MWRYARAGDPSATAAHDFESTRSSRRRGHFPRNQHAQHHANDALSHPLLACPQRNCEMDFVIDDAGMDSGCEVTLKMSFDASPLALAASPVLAADNALALKVLLRRALDSDGLLLTSAASPLGTMDPIAGPIVKLGRRLGLIPEEEDDGWTGEPTAWARPDSLPQKLSELTSTRLAGFKQWTAEQVAGDFDTAAVDARLEREIASGGVVMFSFTNCPFCKNAKCAHASHTRRAPSTHAYAPLRWLRHLAHLAMPTTALPTSAAGSCSTSREHATQCSSWTWKKRAPRCGPASVRAPAAPRCQASGSAATTAVG